DRSLLRPQFASRLRFVVRSPQFERPVGVAALHRRQNHGSAKWRARTHDQHVKAYFPNCLTRFARDPATLRTRTVLGQRSAALGQNSLKLPLSESTLPPSRKLGEGWAEGFRATAPIAEALLAMRPGTDRSYARAKCKRRPSL